MEGRRRKQDSTGKSWAAIQANNSLSLPQGGSYRATMAPKCCPELGGDGQPSYSCRDQPLGGGKHRTGPDLGQVGCADEADPAGTDS